MGTSNAMYIGVEIGFEPPFGWEQILRGIADEDSAADTRRWIPGEHRSRRTWVVDVRLGASEGYLALSSETQQQQRAALAEKFEMALANMMRVEAFEALAAHRYQVQRLEQLQAELDKQQTALHKLMEGAPSVQEVAAMGAQLATLYQGVQSFLSSFGV